MSPRPIDVIAAGHICLDIIPQLSSAQCRAEDLFVPGELVQVGPAIFALGGSVANTGLALHRLGAKTRLVGKVGDDLFGDAILESLRRVEASIVESMIVAGGEPTSYTIVLSPPQVDRGFLHCSGTNDTFEAADLDQTPWQDTRILHFGYPPLMRGTFADEGRSLARRFSEAQAAGALVSLDMAMPNVASTNWQQWLRNVLPHVDIFLPSADELQLLLNTSLELLDGSAKSQGGNDPVLHRSHLNAMAGELLALGVPIVVIKLGEQGLYLRTSKDVLKLAGRAAWQDFAWHSWQDRELLAPCFEVDVVGTTGSGDCTIAGFLMALLQGLRPEEALRYATTVGAFCVQSADATSNIPDNSGIEAILASPWRQRPLATSSLNWQLCDEPGVYMGPSDENSMARATS
jgi:sugar/nucleoside kinase (ribokinase family)